MLLKNLGIRFIMSDVATVYHMICSGDLKKWRSEWTLLQRILL